MDRTTSLAILALIVSILSLGTSAYLTYRQIRLNRESKHGAALMALYSDLRSLGFHAHYNYVVHQLREDYTPCHGIFGLPGHAQAAVVDVAYYYQNLANMMHFGLLDQKAVLPM